MSGTLNLTGSLERLVADICSRLEEFSHIDTTRLLICLSTTRGGGIHGVYAKIHPLRFAGGARSRQVRRGRRTYTCTMPVIEQRGTEILYIIYFLVPRFFDLPLREKLITIIHELYHISPAFDGDIRRFPGRNYAHGSSTRSYNAAMGKIADSWLSGLADDSILDFLRDDLETLRNRHRMLVGRKMRAPRIQLAAGQSN